MTFILSSAGAEVTSHRAATRTTIVRIMIDIILELFDINDINRGDSLIQYFKIL